MSDETSETSSSTDPNRSDLERSDANPACDEPRLPKEWRTVDDYPTADDLGYPDTSVPVAIGDGRVTMYRSSERETHVTTDGETAWVDVSDKR